MQTEHKVAKWKCVSSCQSNIRIFQTEAEFLTHTENDHKEDFTAEEMIELANIGRHEINRELGADILLECPICTVLFEDHDFLTVYSHIAEELAEYAWISLPESPHADTNVSQKASSKSASIDDGRIGQRRESEIEADKMFPWSLWEFDNLETKSDLVHHDADLKLIPDPSDADVAVLAEIRSDIRNARRERLRQEPDPSQNLLREYKHEPKPDEDGDMDISLEDPTRPLKFDSFNNRIHEGTSRRVKADELKGKRGIIYQNIQSNYSVIVNSLLWADGYEGCPLEGEGTISDREMTLMVLKIMLAAHNQNVKFSFMKASLIFEDAGYKQHQGLSEPQVEAWAPSHSVERQHTLTPYGPETVTDIGFGLTIGSASVGWETSQPKSKGWDQTLFTEVRSNPEISPVTGSRNGVTWVFELNGLEKGPMLQEICVAVLISRASPEPYHVRFQIDTRLGALEDFKNVTKQFFGRNPNKTKPFLVSPGKNVLCNFEGNDIIESIDLKNLGRLRDQGNSSILDLELSKYFKIHT